MTDNETKLRELNTHLQDLGKTLTDVETSFQELKDKYEQGGDVTDEIATLFGTVTGLGATGERLKKLGSAVTVPSNGGTVTEPVDHAVPVVETPVDPFFPAPGTGTPVIVPTPGTPVVEEPVPDDSQGTTENQVDNSTAPAETDAPQVEDVKENAEDTNTETNSQETPANVPGDAPVFDAEVKEDPIFAPKEEDEPFFPASDPATSSNPDTTDTPFNDVADSEANTGEETKPVDQPSDF